ETQPETQPPANASSAPQIWLTWPESQRVFLQEGPCLLLPEEQRNRVLSLDEAGREGFIREFLAHDPIPETPENELEQGIQRRLRLAQSEFPSPRDGRDQLI